MGRIFVVFIESRQSKVVAALRSSRCTSGVGSGDWLLRAYARWELNSHFALTLRGENLADQHYEMTIGFPALGTTLFCGAENPVLKLIVVKSIDSRVRMDHRGVGTPLS